MAEQPRLDRLKSQLYISPVRKEDNALFQVINQLIDAVKQLQEVQNEQISDISGSIDDVSDLTFLTSTDQTSDLPNSRELIAGTNITFDDSVAGERTVNSSVVEREWDVLTDGDLIEPELIFAGGEVIMVHTP